MPNGLLASLNPALARELAMNNLPMATPMPVPGNIGGFAGGTFDIENGRMVQRTPVQRLTQMPADVKPQDAMGGKEKFGGPQTPHRDSGIRRFLDKLAKVMAAGLVARRHHLDQAHNLIAAAMPDDDGILFLDVVFHLRRGGEGNSGRVDRRSVSTATTAGQGTPVERIIFQRKHIWAK